jgi:hypothetical protein
VAELVAGTEEANAEVVEVQRDIAGQRWRRRADGGGRQCRAYGEPPGLMHVTNHVSSPIVGFLKIQTINIDALPSVATECTDFHFSVMRQIISARKIMEKL